MHILLVPQHVSWVLLAFKQLHPHLLIQGQTQVKRNLSPGSPLTQHRGNSCHQSLINPFRSSFTNLSPAQSSYCCSTSRQQRNQPTKNNKERCWSIYRCKEIPHLHHHPLKPGPWSLFGASREKLLYPVSEWTRLPSGFR